MMRLKKPYSHKYLLNRPHNAHSNRHDCGRDAADAAPASSPLAAPHESHSQLYRRPPLRLCVTARAIMRHVLACADDACAEPRCVVTRQLLAHHSVCVLDNCPVCVPVRAAVHASSQDVPPAADW